MLNHHPSPDSYFLPTLISLSPQLYVRSSSISKYLPPINSYYLQITSDHQRRKHTSLLRLWPAWKPVMSATSSDLAEGSRPKLNLLGLPQEIKDRIFGFIVHDRYTIFRYLREDPPLLRGDDFRHLSILRVSKRVKREVMQVLQMKSWFICKLPPWITIVLPAK